MYFYVFCTYNPKIMRSSQLNIMGFCPEHPKVRPKSEIYTPKRDDKHPHLFHMQSPPPRNFITGLPSLPLSDLMLVTVI